MTRSLPVLLLSPEHPCPYLPEQTARTLFLDPRMDARPEYAKLLAQGFRRNGPFMYRPYCANCHACVPLRIPVREFRPDRGQRRVWNRNRDLAVQLRAARFEYEHFALYLRYQRWKHPGGGMDQSSAEDYANFLMMHPGEALLAEMRLREQLMAVAVMDVSGDSMSAVYTFYTPDAPRRSLGTYAILREIAEARRRRLAWLYLGYWVAASQKMAYKDRFLPHERLLDNRWQRISRTGH
ncbi:MAG TPA: arginyltransferase [Gammaproteobacteria bacterium]|nr:arginyltransferase [Gammaproteobacteria bacterium]